MILNYTLPDAERNILAGIKIHTLREDRKDRWQPGKMIHHTTGARSKKYKCFLQNHVVSTQLVLIVFDKIETTTNLIVTIDRRRLKTAQIIEFARNDGFTSIKDFVNWFFPYDKKTGYRKRTMWAGKLIHWTDFKYTAYEKQTNNSKRTSRQGKLAC